MNTKDKTAKLLEITEIMRDTPLVGISDLQKALKKNNYHASVYEKIFVLESQIGYLKQLRIDHLERQSSFSVNAEQDIYTYDQIEEFLSEKYDLLDRFKEKYENLYEKSLTFYY